MLTRAGLGDDARLADALGQERLTEHVVDLVGAGVVQVLSLQEDPGSAGVASEAGNLGQDARTTGVVRREPVNSSGRLDRCAPFRRRP